VKWTAYIDDGGGAIYFRGPRPALLNGEDGRPLGEAPLVRVEPGDEFAGRSFKEWHHFLKARCGAASVKIRRGLASLD
jgi:hypothetical protein